MTLANPTRPWSSYIDLFYLSIRCRDPCVIGELQTREIDVNVPESLLKNVACEHQRMAITRCQHSLLRTSQTRQINRNWICKEVMKELKEDEARYTPCLYFKSHLRSSFRNQFSNKHMNKNCMKTLININKTSLWRNVACMAIQLGGFKIS